MRIALVGATSTRWSGAAAEAPELSLRASWALSCRQHLHAFHGLGGALQAGACCALRQRLLRRRVWKG